MTHPQVYTNVNCLRPLAEIMTREDPKSRPTASEALEYFDVMVKKLPLHVIHWKAKQQESQSIVHLYQNIISVGLVGAAYTRRIVSMYMSSNCC